MSSFIDLTGRPFGRLTVIERGPKRNRTTRWWCLCACGTRCLVRRDHLVDDRTTSCGCFQKEEARTRKLIHGMRRTPEYEIWHKMKSRCLNPNNIGYHLYGGRGITICQRWQDSFEAFYADMGPRPSPQHSLDRYPDQNGPYIKTNCRWATCTEQGRNKRNNHLLTYAGKTQCLRAWAEELSIDARTLRYRVCLGWSDERSLTTPVHYRHKNSP